MTSTIHKEINKRPFVESLNGRHFKILDLHIKGWTTSQIAKHLEITASHVSIVINSPIFQHELSMRRAVKDDSEDVADSVGDDEVQQTLRQGAKDAAAKLVSGLKSDNEKNALRSAAEILDRTGHPKTQRTEGGLASAIVVVTEKDVKRIQNALELDKDGKSKANEEQV